MDEDTIQDMALGDNIRALRERRAMTPKTLAERVGVTVQSVSQWETSKTKPSLKNREKLCDLFGISLEELASRRLPTEKLPDETNMAQSGEEMVEKNLSLLALRTALSILRRDLAPDETQALAVTLLDLVLNPPEGAAGVSYEDHIRSLYQGALAARSALK